MFDLNIRYTFMGHGKVGAHPYLIPHTHKFTHNEWCRGFAGIGSPRENILSSCFFFCPKLSIENYTSLHPRSVRINRLEGLYTVKWRYLVILYSYPIMSHQTTPFFVFKLGVFTVRFEAETALYRKMQKKKTSYEPNRSYVSNRIKTQMHMRFGSVRF